MKPFYRLSDAEFSVWYGTFRDGATTYASSLGLTPSDITAITNAAADFSSILGVADAAKVAAKSATTEKNGTRATTQALAQKFAKEFKANVNVSDGIIEALGLPPRDAPAYGPPQIPSNLNAVGKDTGVNQLTWKKNGNAPNTTYSVEARVGTEGQWTLIGATLRTSFNHKNQTPGVFVSYRVFATRDGVSTDYSATASVYNQGEGDTFVISQAA